MSKQINDLSNDLSKETLQSIKDEWNKCGENEKIILAATGGVVVGGALAGGWKTTLLGALVGASVGAYLIKKHSSNE